MKKIVARFTDGRVLKGTTLDFSPDRETFHVVASSPVEGGEETEVLMEELKALFYVKDFSGDPGRVDSQELSRPIADDERAVGVIFRDGELMVGTTPRTLIGGRGFFLVPADSDSNNEKCFILLDATRDVSEIC